MLFPRKYLDSLSRFQSRTRLSPSDVTAVCGAASLLFHFRCRGWQLAPTTGTNGARATESGRRAIHPSLYIHPSESSCVLVLLTIHASLALDESCELLSSVVSDDSTTLASKDLVVQLYSLVISEVVTGNGLMGCTGSPLLHFQCDIPHIQYPQCTVYSEKRRGTRVL